MLETLVTRTAQNQSSGPTDPGDREMGCAIGEDHSTCLPQHRSWPRDQKFISWPGSGGCRRAAVYRPIDAPPLGAAIHYNDSGWGDYLHEAEVFDGIFKGLRPSTPEERDVWPGRVSQAVEYVRNLTTDLARSRRPPGHRHNPAPVQQHRRRVGRAPARLGRPEPEAGLDRS
jgi:hypothetical protein